MRVECRGRRVRFLAYEEVLPNGNRVLVDRVEFPASAVVLPVFSGSGEVVLLRQYRPAIGEWLVEAPAGTLKEGEAPEEAAARELEEEAGLRPGRLVKVGEGYVAPGYTTEYMHLYLALDPVEGERSPEEHEVIEPFRVKLDEALAMAARGEIRDVKTLLLLYAAAHILSGKREG